MQKVNIDLCAKLKYNINLK